MRPLAFGVSITTSWMSNERVPFWLRLLLSPLALLMTGIWWIIAAVVSLALLWLLAVGGLIALGFLLTFFESFWGLA